MERTVYRGEMYYIMADGAEIGHEQQSGRPGIVVSNDKANKYSNVVEIVYLTTQEKVQLATHVHIDSAKRPSIALCEQIQSVDKVRLGDYFGTLTKEELVQLDDALIESLGLDLAVPISDGDSNKIDEIITQDKDEVPAMNTELEYVKVCVERDTYKNLLMNLIERKA